ncbi:MAG: GAF and HD-GYP domain-containing protein [Thermodesulfovibrionales bacterium]
MASPESDLALTVRELSNAYEELTLLYRMSEVFSFLSIEEICLRMAEEAVNSIGVETSAVLIADEGNQNLHTKAFRGSWDDKRVFARDAGVIWKAIDSKKPSAFCALAQTEHQAYFPGMASLMVCPILGKARVMGALVVADKGTGGEFLSSDSKLLMAITSQAGLAIENALLYKELESLLVGAIKALVKALEASSCWTAGHTERVTEYALGIGRALGVNADLLERLKISALLHDIGKIATPKEILNKNDALDEEEWREIRRHPLLGAEILVELQQFEDIILSIKYHHEHWDGKQGLFKLKHGEIPLMARILSVADAFDAMTSDRPYRSMMTRDEAVREIVNFSGTQFDPAVVDAFLAWIKGSGPTPQHPVS